jgi:hypothetical protein
VLYHISIHHPNPEFERELVDSMHRFGKAASSLPGSLGAHTLKDRSGDVLVGLAMWESADALTAARPALGAVVANDDFDTWEIRPTDVYLLEEV